MAGRKPKPTAMKLLHGNPGKRPINDSEPVFSGKPVKQAWLSSLAQEEWDRVTELLAETNMLKGTDQAALESYCVNYAQWRTAIAQVERDGQTVVEWQTDKEGELILHPITDEPLYKLKRHPATIIAKDANILMLKSASLFGFDPSSRSRVQVPEGAVVPAHVEDDDDLLAPARDSGRTIH